MRFLAVDDEPYILEELRETLERARPAAEVLAFCRPSEALEAVRATPIDTAFLDVEMGSMSGLELAAELKRLQPETHIIFVTGHPKYAVNAFQIHATGYLLKPISLEALERELTFLYEAAPACRMKVQTFGGFEVFVDGKPMKFGRSKAKELLAYLIDKRGATATTAEAYSVLFEEAADTVSGKSMFRNIVRDLRLSLGTAGVEDVLLRGFNSLAIVPEMLDCDYYRFLAGDPAAVNQYHGDYLPQYSWAEFRNGSLGFQDLNE